MEGAVVRPGDLIKVADSHKAGVRYGGRIAAGSTTTTVKLDAATSVTAGKTYKLSLINTEEACIQSGVKQAETTQETCLNANVDNEWKPYVWVETKNVTTIASTEKVTEITVTSAFANTPTTNYMWILEEMGSVEAQDFRVLMTRESGPNLVEISALKYHGGEVWIY